VESLLERIDRPSETVDEEVLGVRC
jgi:hypothetical protein